MIDRMERITEGAAGEWCEPGIMLGRAYLSAQSPNRRRRGRWVRVWNVWAERPEVAGATGQARYFAAGNQLDQCCVGRVWTRAGLEPQ